MSNMHLDIAPDPIRVEIAIGDGLFESELPKTLRKIGKRIAILADSSIAFGKTLQEAAGGELFLYQGGEAAKTRQTKEKLEDALLKRKFGRDTLLVGLGGGVVTDMAAFLASTYMRGVQLVLVPTTLLAMVDAAIGGKSAVDTPFGKNLIGAVYQPSHIFIDPKLLATLPDREWTYGLAEILKYGLIADPAIWDLLETRPWKESLQPLLLASVRAKIGIVEKDPFETKGLRRILNFGHTIGHALETLSNYRMPHGEAVAIGCIAESALSYRLGYLSENEWIRIKTLMKKFPFAYKLPKPLDPDRLIEAMQIDKKAKGGEPRFVLIDRIGSPLPFDGEYCRPVPILELESLIQESLCLNG